MKKIYKYLLLLSLKFSNFLYKLISYLAIKYEGGIHPKHRLLGYHDFFTNNIGSNETVLDIGCGNGALSYNIAKKAKHVTGVDIESKNINEATRRHSRENLKYIVGDATKDLVNDKFDIITLSNVLEHIEFRVDFLKQIKGIATKYLIRVPMFDRDWIPLYKKELGIEWRLDLTHFTEFTKDSFYKEFGEAGYTIESFSVQFGEIWAVVKPQ